MMNKKDYSSPEMKVMEVHSEERFTSVCGTTYMSGDHKVSTDCLVSWTPGEVEVPMNS